MKLKDLVNMFGGNENVELHIDACQLDFTAKNTPEKYMEHEIKSIRLDPRTYLGIIVHIKDESEIAI